MMEFIVQHALVFIDLTFGGATMAIFSLFLGGVLSGFSQVGDVPAFCLLNMALGLVAFLIGVIPTALLVFRMLVQFVTS